MIELPLVVQELSSDKSCDGSWSGGLAEGGGPKPQLASHAEKCGINTRHKVWPTGYSVANCVRSASVIESAARFAELSGRLSPSRSRSARPLVTPSSLRIRPLSAAT